MKLNSFSRRVSRRLERLSRRYSPRSLSDTSSMKPISFPVAYRYDALSVFLIALSGTLLAFFLAYDRYGYDDQARTL